MSGQRQQGGRVLAGFWRRALAALLDALLVAVLAIAAEAGYLASTGSWEPDFSDPAQPIVGATVALAAVLYDLLLTWRIGGTLGKRALGIRVAPREGGRPGFGQLLGRMLARLISLLPALLGFWWAGWDRRKQTWHDKLADTVVVRDDAPVARPVAAPLPAQDAGGAMLPPSSGGEESAGGPPSSAGSEEGDMPADIAVAAAAAGGVAAGPAHEDTGPLYRSGAPQAPGQNPMPQPAASPSGPVESPPQPPAPPQSPPQSAAPPQWASTQSAAPPTPPQQPAWNPEPAAGMWAPQAPQSMPQAAPQPPGGLAPPPGMPTRNDPNRVAIGRAGLGHDAATWLQQVADQVDARLDRISGTWRGSPHAEAARACAFGLLLGHLARLYPHMRPELNATAELHPSFSTLLEGSRLATLEQIVAEPGRIAAWLGPLIDVQEPERIRTLLD